ncbi:hypothetical protein CW304_01500 [Bacillus sp. UFRGS-B20]|nr:hypothetical protein CW304_01500 [Bacillus sp. UFRGS-B20]
MFYLFKIFHSNPFFPSYPTAILFEDSRHSCPVNPNEAEFFSADPSKSPIAVFYNRLPIFN